MTLLKRIGVLVAASITIVGATQLGDYPYIHGVPAFISRAEAKVGRPLTPVSVAGVARRSARRCAAGVYNC